MVKRNEPAKWPPPGAPETVVETIQSFWVMELAATYDRVNRTYAGGRLRRPLILLGDSESEFGRWDPNRRAITISKRHILAHPWHEVVDTLVHEMAHQYVDEVMGCRGVQPHGEEFRRACRLLHVEPRATADLKRTGRLEDSDEKRDRMLQRVKELLALASSPNEHEAETAVRLANKYLLKYNLSLSDLERDRRHYTYKRVGEAKLRIQEYEYILSNILEEHFFVVSIWIDTYMPLRMRRGRILELCGSPENLEIAAYVYDYVMNVGELLWKAYRKRMRDRKGITKFRYLAGLLSGFRDKLDRQRTEVQREYGLVHIGDAGLDEYFSNRYPFVSRRSVTGVARTEEFAHGYRDGERLTLHRGIDASARDRGRSLPPP